MEQVFLMSNEQALIYLNLNLKYIYRIVSVNINKVTLEKHEYKLDKSLDGTGFSFKISDNTLVGTVTQKVKSDILDLITLSVNHIIYDFSMKDGEIISIERLYTKLCEVNKYVI